MTNLESFRLLSPILFLAHLLLPTPTLADFKPEEVVLLCNESIKESCELANFYASKRSVPIDNLVKIQASPEEKISREQFSKTILQPLKSKLESSSLLDKLKVLVTFYGIPLAIEDSQTPLPPQPYQLASAPEIPVNSGASVDSELTLIKIQPGGAPISNRLNNPLFIEDITETKEHSRAILSSLKTLTLVSRLDGSSPELVKKIITDSIEVEKSQNLEGNFLIDGRGLPWDQQDDYALWDKSFVKLARKIETGDRFEIEFDGHDSIAGETKDIALYTGWYSLRKYEDLYTFKKGAVGYHIASEEAVSLRSPEEKGWCKNLMDHGVVATLGAVSEPYLDSFPKPYDFFTLLLSGKYQLVEVYYLTEKFLSWKMVLIGDPLYKPISEKTARKEFDYDTEDYNELPIAPSALMKN